MFWYDTIRSRYSRLLNDLTGDTKMRHLNILQTQLRFCSCGENLDIQSLRVQALQRRLGEFWNKAKRKKDEIGSFCNRHPKQTAVWTLLLLTTISAQSFALTARVWPKVINLHNVHQIVGDHLGRLFRWAQFKLYTNDIFSFSMSVKVLKSSRSS